MFRRLGKKRAAAVPAVERLEPRDLPASITLPGAGPIAALTVGDDGSFQLKRADFAAGQFYNPSSAPGDVGFFVRQTDGTVDGLNLEGRNTAAQDSKSQAFHPISNAVTGDGHTAVTVVDNSTDGTANTIQVTQTTRLEPGAEFFRVENVVRNGGDGPITVDLFAAGDIYLSDSDLGVGYRDAISGAVGGTDKTGAYHIFIQPDTSTGNPAPNGFQESYYADVWKAIGGGAGSHFNNGVLAASTPAPYSAATEPNYLDNGAGLEWKSVTIPAGESVAVSYYWAFGNPTHLPIGPTMSAGPAVVADAVEGQPLIAVLGTFNDTKPDASATDYTAIIQWSDGSAPSMGTVRPHAGGGFAVEAVHTFTQPLLPSQLADPNAWEKATIDVSANDGRTIRLVGSVRVHDAALTLAGTTLAATAGVAYEGVVAHLSDANPSGTSVGLTTTIDWGDGSAVDQGALGFLQPAAGGGFDVVGRHTYAVARTGTVAVAVTSLYGSSASATSPISVRATNDASPAISPLSGSLVPSSDSGVSDSDHITNVRTPRFEGKGPVGATVRLYAVPVGSNDTQALGQALIGADGTWTITSASLPDGVYGIRATATSRAAEGTLTADLIPSTDKPLQIDTLGPSVTDVRILPRSGQIVLSMRDDRTGLDVPSVLAPSAYRFVREHEGRVVDAFRIRSVKAPTFVKAPSPTETVAFTIDTGTNGRIGHGCRYVFTAYAARIRDTAGNALDGEYVRRLPSGNGASGGDFAANLLTDGRRGMPPKPLHAPFCQLSLRRPSLGGR